MRINNSNKKKILLFIVGCLLSFFLAIKLYVYFILHYSSILKYVRENSFTFNHYFHMLVLALFFIQWLLFALYKDFVEYEKKCLKSYIEILHSIIKQLYDLKFLLCVIVIFVAIYGYQISNITINVDEEFQMTQAKNCIQWCYEGRFSIAILKSIFMQFGMYEPFLASFIGDLFYLLAGLTLLQLITEKSSNREITLGMKCAFLTAALSFPSVIVEVSSFSIYWIEVSFGIFCAVFAVSLIDKFLITNKLHYSIFSIILTAFAFGIYQAIVGIYISSIIFYLFVCVFNEETIKTTQLKNYVFTLLKSIFIFIVSLGLFFLIYKIATSIHRIDSSIEYVNSFSNWDFNLGIIKSFTRSVSELISILSLRNIPGITFFYFYLVAGIVLCVYLMFSQWFIKGLICSLLLICLQISAFIMWLGLASTYLPFRGWLSAPLVCGMTYFLVLYCTYKPNKKFIYCILCFIISVILFRQVQTTNHLFYNDHIRMEKDVAFAEEVYHEISKLYGTPSSDTPIVFIGIRDITKDSPIIENPKRDSYWGGNILGYSLWCRAQEPHRMKGLYACLGYSVDIQPLNYTEQLGKEIQKMTIFPMDGSIKKIGSKIYVKLE